MTAGASGWHNPSQNVVGWNEWAAAAGVPLQNIQRGIRYSDAAHLVRAAVAGQGVALIGKRMIEAELRDGLLQIARSPEIDGSLYHLCVPHRHQNTAAVQTVKNWLLAQAGV